MRVTKQDLEAGSHLRDEDVGGGEIELFDNHRRSALLCWRRKEVDRHTLTNNLVLSFVIQSVSLR